MFVEYFKKQGFTEDVRISKKIHQEYIKHYQGAILMHCEINPKIIYTQLTSVIRVQKEVSLYNFWHQICISIISLNR